MKPRFAVCCRKTSIVKPKISCSFTAPWRSRYKTTMAQKIVEPKTFVQNVDSTNIISASVRSTDPRQFWSNPIHQRHYMDWLANKKGFKDPEDWYSIRTEDISELHGKTILQLHKNSISSLLRKAYPEYSWKWWKFSHVPLATWQDPKNLREYFDGFAKEHNVTRPEDWVKFTQKDFKQQTLFKLHGGLDIVLGIAYPELASFFKERRWLWKVPPQFWNNQKHVREFCDFFMQKCGLESLEEWYFVSVDQMMKLGAGGLLRKYGSVAQVVATAYPEHSWDKSRFDVVTKGKEMLYILAQRLFPHVEVKSNVLMKSVMPEAEMASRTKPRYDVYIPAYKLALMYLSRMHYGYSIYQGKPALKQQRFQEKVQVNESQGITVISIPYWWDHCKDTLQATIHKHRPDVIPPVDAEPIPEEQQEKDISDSPLDKWCELRAPGWSDAFKAFWDGESTFYMDDGGSIKAPKEYAQKMPSMVTEGELYINSSGKVIHCEPVNWEDVTFRVFDTVQKEPSPYATRLESLKNVIEPNPSVDIIEGSYANSVEAMLQHAAESDCDQFLIRHKHLLGFPNSHTIYQNWPIIKATVVGLSKGSIVCQVDASTTVKVPSKLRPEPGCQALLQIGHDMPAVLVQLRKGFPSEEDIPVTRFVLTPEFVFSPIKDLTCRHCHKPLTDTNKVEIRAAVQPEDSGPVPHREYTCSTPECLKGATTMASFKYPDSKVFVPPYDGLIGVTAKGKALLRNNLPNVEAKYHHVTSYLAK